MDLSNCPAFKSAINAIKVFIERLGEASIAILFIMIPIVISSIPHWIRGTFNKFANGPDVAMLCAVLYLDAWWKVRARHKLDPSAKATLEVCCVFGAMFATAFASFIYADDMGLLTLSLANNKFTNTTRPIVFGLGFFFSIWVRVRSNAPESKS